MRIKYLLSVLLYAASVQASSEALTCEKSAIENGGAQDFFAKNRDLLKVQIGSAFGGSWVEYDGLTVYNIVALTKPVDINQQIICLGNVKIIYVRYGFDELVKIQNSIKLDIEKSQFREIFSIYLDVKKNSVVVVGNAENLDYVKNWLASLSVDIAALTVIGQKQQIELGAPIDRVNYK